MLWEMDILRLIRIPFKKWPKITEYDLKRTKSWSKVKRLKKKPKNATMNLMSFVPSKATSPETLAEEQAQAPNRIEALVTRHGISYYDLAKQMGVTRTTVHAVKNRQRPASKKFLVKLAGAEKRIDATAVGQKPTTKTEQSLLEFAVNTLMPVEEMLVEPDVILVTPKSTDTVPKPEPIKIELHNPGLSTAIKAIIQAHTDNKCNELLKLCLPKEYANDNWIEQMSPSSYLWAIKKSVIICLGKEEWKTELARLIARTQ